MHSPTPPPEDLRAVAETAARAAGARRVILFGSRARGDHRPDSDVDLLLLFDDDSDLRRAVIEAGRALYPRFWALDIVPMRVRGFEQRTSDLAVEVAREGVVLYG